MIILTKNLNGFSLIETIMSLLILSTVSLTTMSVISLNNKLALESEIESKISNFQKNLDQIIYNESTCSNSFQDETGNVIFTQPKTNIDYIMLGDDIIAAKVGSDKESSSENTKYFNVTNIKITQDINLKQNTKIELFDGGDLKTFDVEKRMGLLSIDIVRKIGQLKNTTKTFNYPIAFYINSSTNKIISCNTRQTSLVYEATAYREGMSIYSKHCTEGIDIPTEKFLLFGVCDSDANGVTVFNKGNVLNGGKTEESVIPNIFDPYDNHNTLGLILTEIYPGGYTIDDSANPNTYETGIPSTYDISTPVCDAPYKHVYNNSSLTHTFESNFFIEKAIYANFDIDHMCPDNNDDQLCDSGLNGPLGPYNPPDIDPTQIATIPHPLYWFPFSSTVVPFVYLHNYFPTRNSTIVGDAVITNISEGRCPAFVSDNSSNETDLNKIFVLCNDCLGDGEYDGIGCNAANGWRIKTCIANGLANASTITTAPTVFRHIANDGNEFCISQYTNPHTDRAYSNWTVKVNVTCEKIVN